MTVERMEGTEPLAETESSASSTTAVADAEATAQAEQSASPSSLDSTDDVVATSDQGDSNGSSAVSDEPASAQAATGAPADDEPGQAAIAAADDEPRAPSGASADDEPAQAAIAAADDEPRAPSGASADDEPAQAAIAAADDEPRAPSGASADDEPAHAATAARADDEPSQQAASAEPAEEAAPAAELQGSEEASTPAEPATEEATVPSVTAEATDDALPAQAASTHATAVAEPPAADFADAPTASDEEDETAADEGTAAEAPSPEAATPAAAPEPFVDTRPEPTTMEELLSEQTGEIRSLKHGDVVEGSVVRIDKDEILVDIGAKSEGVVSNRELYGRNAESQPALNIGDVVLVYVLQPESNEGHAVLSLRRAGLERKWRAMQEQLDAGVIIEAPVIDHNKGGLIVDCGIRGFVPISQIVDFPRRPQNEQPRDAAQEIAEKLQPYVGRKLRLKILEVNRKANRLILSEKVALYEERREKRDELFSSLKVGQQVKGSVRSIAPFGVFVDLGGIDGLVHKSELSWNKVNNPESGYRVGEEVEAEVIDINHERGRISLSIRRLQPDPWHSTVADLKLGDIIEGTVTKIVNFGAFVRVREGLEGLIHISELSQQRVAHPGDVVHEGQKLRLKVISLDSERHRLGLSLKQAEEAPARPAGEPAQGTTAPRERRGRSDRSYDPSQAVQEPEGGIDNTLAAAFAQVRQQIAEQDLAASDEPEPAEAAPVAAAAETHAEAETAAQGDAPADAEATAEPAKGKAEAATDAEPDAATEPEATAEAEPAKGKAEAATDAEPDAATEPEATAEAEPAKGKAEAATDAEPDAATEPEATAEAEPAKGKAEADTDGEPGTATEHSPRASRAKKEPAAAAAGDETASAGVAEPEAADATEGTDEEPLARPDVSALDINPDSVGAVETAAEATDTDEANGAG